MRGQTILILGTALAGCGQQPGNTAITTNAVAPVETGYIAKVLALPQGQLNGVLYRAIDDAKRPCQGIAGRVRQPDRNGKPVWAVRCIDGSAWVVMLNDNGMAEVTGIPGHGGG